MTAESTLHVDVVIFGGGAAGLWLLDDLIGAGYRVLLLEASALGTGQTIASQGIIHGGLKYSLGGLLTPSARTIREMPALWRRCLAGERTPDLSRARRRAEFCHLWQTKSLTSRLAMLGARRGLRVAPTPLPLAAWPEPLRRCPGSVARLEEQVVELDSLLGTLAEQHASRLLRIDAISGLELVTTAAGHIEMIRLINPETGEPMDLRARHVLFTAGAGNGTLRRRAGLDESLQQCRPLHMATARGDLPILNGHCVDGMHTRATITTTSDYEERTIWQIGGQIAEDGVEMDRPSLIRHARAELEMILPGVDLSEAEWATYRVDRVEGRVWGGRRPAGAQIHAQGNTITAWPTKMALVAQLSAQVLAQLPPPEGLPSLDEAMLRLWPRPTVALPPWEEDESWSTAG